MRAVIAIIGLVLGGLLGAYIGIHASGELLLKYQTFASPDDVSAQSHMVMFSMMGIVGIIGGIVGWLVAKFIFKH